VTRGDGARDPLIAFAGVSKVYGAGDAAVRALDGVDLAIEDGAFVAITGSSGSGKSTALNVIGCLDAPSAGDYRFGGIDAGRLERRRRSLLRRHFLGFVFQGFNLLARNTALENVEMPLVYRGLPPRERRRRAFRALERVGLADRARHLPSELSGGQQQRVAIARAIVTDPLVLLADEPTGNLDRATGRRILELLSSLHRDQGITLVMVTHEADVSAYAGRTIRFADGRVEADERGAF
jgi:putative ABC transport system ATP-binding protein